MLMVEFEHVCVDRENVSIETDQFSTPPGRTPERKWDGRSLATSRYGSGTTVPGQPSASPDRLSHATTHLGNSVPGPRNRLRPITWAGILYECNGFIIFMLGRTFPNGSRRRSNPNESNRPGATRRPSSRKQFSINKKFSVGTVPQDTSTA
jgi:hypothetical protein